MEVFHSATNKHHPYAERKKGSKYVRKEGRREGRIDMMMMDGWTKGRTKMKDR
jgi:hypothetical protein